jgi:hypothetical protein
MARSKRAIEELPLTSQTLPNVVQAIIIRSSVVVRSHKPQYHTALSYPWDRACTDPPGVGHGDGDAVEREGYGNSRMWVAMLTMASIP